MAEVEDNKMKQLGAAPEPSKGRFPYCVVWTPIPMLTHRLEPVLIQHKKECAISLVNFTLDSNDRWLFPIIGHMGICTSSGVIRDFAGPYYVSEDNMAFGRPVKYWRLDPNKVHASGPNAWDTAVHEASEEYKHRMHNLCCDNCHSHVALALNLMRYNGSSSWNMVKLCFLMLVHGKYVSFGGFLKTWLPFILVLGIGITVWLALHLR